MKLQHALLSVCLPLIGAAAAQTTYNDATGEIDANVGNLPHLDIASVVVSTDGADVTFRINLNGDPVAVDWGKYMIGIRSGGGGAPLGNGWARPIHFAPGMTHWIGSWVDNGNGAQTWTYNAANGGSWSNPSAPSITKDTTGLTITATAASLGLAAGETMIFDVYSSGSGSNDSAVDALSASSASITSWSGPYTTQLATSGTNAALEFTMPGTLTFANWIAGFGLAAADQEPGDDPDVDGLTNQQEFDANPDLNPNSYDTDGDGKADGADAEPLNPVRDVQFSVNMSAQIALGAFDPDTETVVVDFFDGVVGPLDDLALSDPDEDGIYTGTLDDLAGATGLNSGGYKFKIVKTGDDLFENDISNRSFTLGAGNPAQALPTVYFNNVSTTFGLWAAENAGSGAASDDYDGDGVDNGVEYFMGETGSTFTANPQPDAGRVVSWPHNPAATDAQFKIWQSTNLSDWTDVTGAADTSNQNFVRYTIPTGDPQVFVRFAVTVP